MVQAEYNYNALAQQVVRRLGQLGYRIHSVHDVEGNRLAEYQIDNTTGVSTLLQEYVWHEGVPVAVVDGATDAVYLIRTDHIGRPVFAADTSGMKVWEATYLPFGGVHVSTSGPIELRFPGQWFQRESGLNQNWMREYDPTSGRYIQADPLGLVDGASVYGYALQNPGRYVDPRGTCVGPLVIPCGFIAIGGGSGTGILSGAGTGIAIGLGIGVAVIPSTPSDGTGSKAEKATERRTYSRYCKTPPPKTGDYCEDLKNELLHAKQCLALREAFGIKWFGGADHGHAVENANLGNRIKNKEDQLRDSCPNQCDILGLNDG